MSKTKPKEVTKILDKLKRHFGKTLEDANLEQIYQACALCVRDEIVERWINARNRTEKEGRKIVIYLSAEFLMGRALINNMINLDLFDKYKIALEYLNIDILDVENEENDAALGNGGLGRLAACFLDSLSTLNMPAMGCGIRYEHGLFRQRILEGAQVEIEDDWIDTGHVWEIESPEDELEVHFGGEIKEHWTEQGLKIEHYNYHTVLAVPYDMPVEGYESQTPATLRLWSARAKKNLDMTYFNRGDYTRATEEKELAEVISKVLYPEDNHEAGRQLRLKQFYFFSSATMQYMVKRHKRLYKDLHTLPKYVSVQINDTHPTVAIPELMRILMDEEGMGWDEAYRIVSEIFNYTNHTVMAEALECWPKDMFKIMLPRIYSIIETINEKYCAELWKAFPGDFEKISNLSIVAYNEIRMANLCVAVCKHVNGVSQIHGEILKTNIFRDNYVMHPSKFLAVTNGITHRRWLAKANPDLTALMAKYIGKEFLTDYRKFEDLVKYTDDPEFLAGFAAVKQKNKERLCKFLKEKQGLTLNPNAIFDVQAKRLHEYKRQMLKVLHILYLYNKLIEDPGFMTQPVTFIFAAKASPGYIRAKNIIRLINAVGDLVNNDPRTKDILQVVFIENYGVSSAEVLIPATDVSEQLSTAGKEGSGTSNMKFMMNGAVILGTMDGANIEIYDQVGKENMFIFGANVEEISHMQKYDTYRPEEYYEKDAELRNALLRMIDGSLPNVGERQFADLYHSLVFGSYEKADRYFLLYDFRSYANAFQQMLAAYQNKQAWSRKGAYNTAKSGVFSSDRTIEEYAKLIWGLS